MAGKRNPEARFRAAIGAHRAGIESALDNAARLFGTAKLTAPDAVAAASFLAGIGAEETGKAVLLRRRAAALIYNANARLNAVMFPDEPSLANLQLRSVQSWDVFAGRASTHRGGLHDHEAKLAALRDYYSEAHPHFELDGDTIVVSTIDMFSGLKPLAIRGSIESALYVSWDGAKRAWRQPQPCLTSVEAFSDAMLGVVDSMRTRIEGDRRHSDGQLDYLSRTVAALDVDAKDVFVP